MEKLKLTDDIAKNLVGRIHYFEGRKDHPHPILGVKKRAGGYDISVGAGTWKGEYCKPQTHRSHKYIYLAERGEEL